MQRRYKIVLHRQQFTIRQLNKKLSSHNLSTVLNLKPLIKKSWLDVSVNQLYTNDVDKCQFSICISRQKLCDFPNGALRNHLQQSI